MDASAVRAGLGLLQRGRAQIGRRRRFHHRTGDFAACSAACVARQCAEVLGALGTGSILEIGAGSGRLAVDMLSRLEALGALPARYSILEISADLRERQRAPTSAAPAALAGASAVARSATRGAFRRASFSPTKCWMPCRSPAFDGIATGWRRLGVVMRDGRFAWEPRPAGAAMTAACRRLVAGRRRLGRRLCVGILSAPRRLDPQRHRLSARRCSTMVRLRPAAIAILSAGAARGHVAVPFPTSSARRSVSLSRIAGHHGVGGLHRARRGFPRRRLLALAGFTTQSYFLAGLGGGSRNARRWPAMTPINLHGWPIRRGS